MKRFAKRVMGVSGLILIGGCALPLDGANPVGAVRLAPARDDGAAEGQYALGKYYLGENRAALALVAFTRALELNEAHVEARNGRATALAQLGDLDSAARELELAIAKAPEAAHLHGNLGYLLLMRDRFTEAARSLRRAFELDPRNPRVRANWELLASRASTNPEVLAGLESRLSISRPGLEPVPPVAITAIRPSTINEIAAQSVVNIAYDRPVSRILPGVTDDRSAAVPGNTRVVNVVTAPAVTAPPAAQPATVDPVSQVRADAQTGVVNVPDPSAAMLPQSFQVPPRSSGPAIGVVNVTTSSDPERPTEKQNVSVTYAPSPGQTVSMTSTTTATVPPQNAAAVLPSPAERAPAPPRKVRARVEIENGNGVNGMARRYREQLVSKGQLVVRVGNADSFAIARSRVEFRDGYLEQALSISRTIGVRPTIALDTRLGKHADIRIVLGRDASSRGGVLADAASPQSPLTLAAASTRAN